ncbi:MAG: FHA domain-containing protein [Thermoanaerobaculia bacterium]
MPFVIQRVTGRSLALMQSPRMILRIGRGTTADIRSENPAVALEHAVIEGDGQNYSISDRGSITGTYVNGKPVESAGLKKGDVIEIGDLRIEIQVMDFGKPMFLRVSEPRGAAPMVSADFDEEDAGDDTARKRMAAGGGGIMRAPKVDYAGSYRLKRMYLTKASLAIALLIVALATIGEVTRPENQSVFMPGGVSSSHSRARDANGNSIANDCAACHDPWRGVVDDKCTACHGPKAHSERQANAPSCMDCHPEHRANPKLASQIAVSQCVACHADVRKHLKGSAPPSIVARISTFAGDHPDFEVRSDPDTLKLNHKLHLRPQGLPNSNGVKEMLTCASCHKLNPSRDGAKYDPAPIKFEEHCQRCHRLTFDPRFPTTEVPHGGDIGLTYGFIITTYAGSRDIVGKSPEEIRRIITSRSQVTPDASALLNASQVIKVKCSLCHDVQRKGERFMVTPPLIPGVWLVRANFTHTQHRPPLIDCEKCHAQARDSSKTSDVLIPKKKACVECHGPQNIRVALAGTTQSSGCTSCHREYHVRAKNVPGKPPLQARKSGGVMQSNMGGGAGMLGTILLWAILMLMVVVLVPLGIAFYQRLRAGNEERAAARSAQQQQQKPAAKPIPPMPAAGAAPAAAPKRPAPAAPAAPAKAAPPAPPPPAPAPAPARPAPASPQQPAASPVEATQMIDLGKPGQPASGEPAGTEMMQWYGMLVCTAGPIEGQRFIIEDDGFFIGRDPALSKVVINDSRISKRHVRILPRNGKVFAVDQQSTNGTFIGKAGGQRITEVQLKRGDVVVLADNAASFTYQI